jgi:hypothetical protein
MYRYREDSFRKLVTTAEHGFAHVRICAILVHGYRFSRCQLLSAGTKRACGEALRNLRNSWRSQDGRSLALRELLRRSRLMLSGVWWNRPVGGFVRHQATLNCSGGVSAADDEDIVATAVLRRWRTRPQRCRVASPGGIVSATGLLR